MRLKILLLCLIIGGCGIKTKNKNKDFTDLTFNKQQLKKTEHVRKKVPRFQQNFLLNKQIKQKKMFRNSKIEKWRKYLENQLNRNR